MLCAHAACFAGDQSIEDRRFSRSDSCIAVPSTDRSSRAWKGGEAEQSEFVAATATKDARSRAQLFSGFSKHHPDSDYRDVALLMNLSAESEVGDWESVASDSRRLLRSQTVDNVALLIGAYSFLADALFHIRADDFSVYSKIAEVAWVVACGRNAVQQLRMHSSSKESESVASSAEFTFAVTQAQACLLGNDEAGAFRESDMALRMNPSDPRANYLSALAMLRSTSPNYDVGIFYLVRASTLSPGNDSLKKSTEDLYRAYHGSGRGFDKLWELAAANTRLSSNFRIEPKRAKDHNPAKGAVAVALAGLLGYAMAKDPQATVQTLAGLGQRGTDSSGGSTKVLLFGGEDHRTFLGCLNCPPGAQDSVYTLGGVHGSRATAESVWNKAGEFGSVSSQYSACNPYASDPPVIVEEDGTYLGRLTLNRYHSQIGTGTRYYGWLHDSVCNQGHARLFRVGSFWVVIR